MNKTFIALKHNCFRQKNNITVWIKCIYLWRKSYRNER